MHIAIILNIVILMLAASGWGGGGEKVGDEMLRSATGAG